MENLTPLSRRDRKILDRTLKPYLLLFLLSLLVLLPMVASVKPTPQISSGGITIVYPKINYYQRNQTIEAHFHLFNYTTNFMITNVSSVNCSIHIYNLSDYHITESVLSFDSPNEWNFFIPTNVSNHNGVYPFLVWCNSSVYGNGYISDSFEITEDGKEKESGLVLAGIIILVPFLFAFLLMYWISTLGEEHNVLKLALSLLSICSFFISLWYCGLAVVRFTVWDSMSEALGLTTFIVGCVFFAIVSYFIIYMIRKIFLGIMSKKNEKFDY